MRTASLRADRAGARRCDRGEVTTATILAPVALLLIMAVVQTALVFHARSVVTAAATDAARATQADGGSSAAGDAVASQMLDQSGRLLRNPVVRVVRDGDNVTAHVEAQVTSLVPGWHPTVDANVDAPAETFRPSTSR